MSKLNLKPGAADKVGQFVGQLRNTIVEQGGALVDAQTTGQLLSMESLDHVATSNMQNRFENVVNVIRDVASQVGLESFDNTPAGRQAADTALAAGAVAAMAAGAPSDYARMASEAGARPGAGVTVVDGTLMGSAGSTDYRDNAAMESFDDRELREHLPVSIAFNIFASRQDAFGEMFFPTTVVTPDAGGLDLTVSRMTVFNEVRHAISGKAADFKKRNLIDAYADSGILSDESTALVPVRLEDDSNATYFVDETLVAPSFRVVSGISVPTAPLAIGQTIDLLGISQHPGLIGAGVMDMTDAIDARMTLDAIYIQTGSADVVKFSTARLPRTSFVKTVEGNSREMGLQFSTIDLVVNKNSKAVDGSTVAEFAAIVSNDYTVRLAVDVNGTANLEIGNVKTFASSVTVDSIVDAAGNAISLTAGAGATIVAALAAAKVIGYDLKAARTNSNRRSRGQVVDAVFQTERYAVPLGSPLSVPTPLTSNRDASDLKALISAARIRNSNNAVTVLLNYGEALKAYATGPKRADNNVPQIQGIGRYVVAPFFEEHTLDMLTAINSTKSHEKAADVSAVLVNALRDVAYRAVRDSRLQAALDAVTGGTGEKPKLLVGTDQVISRHLMVSGDSRTFADYFGEFEVQASMDDRMKGKIVLAFGRAGTNGPDPLHFGCHAWMPELASSVQVTRNGATVKESMVQPRSLHVPALPIMAVINVSNLEYALVEKIATPAAASAITHTWL